jgi:F-type H+-transporting ATPase subunit delta
VFYNAVDVKQVDVPSFSGSFGILPNHVPTLAVLKPGVVSVYESEGTIKKYFGNYHRIYSYVCMS